MWLATWSDKEANVRQSIFGCVLLAIVFWLIATEEVGAQWNQWRGANRNGVAQSSPQLIDQLPSDGLKPLWLTENIPGGGNGGWGSPVVANGNVYLYTHYQVSKQGVNL